MSRNSWRIADEAGNRPAERPLRAEEIKWMEEEMEREQRRARRDELEARVGHKIRASLRARGVDV